MTAYDNQIEVTAEWSDISVKPPLLANFAFRFDSTIFSMGIERFDIKSALLLSSIRHHSRFLKAPPLRWSISILASLHPSSSPPLMYKTFIVLFPMTSDDQNLFSIIFCPRFLLKQIRLTAYAPFFYVCHLLQRILVTNKSFAGRGLRRLRLAKDK